jgi:hypothetical protein
MVVTLRSICPHHVFTSGIWATLPSSLIFCPLDYKFVLEKGIIELNNAFTTEIAPKGNRTDPVT